MTETLKITPELHRLLRTAQNVAVVSGAGMSAESSVPTFREVQTGLWERYSAQDLATPEAFEADPATVWTWYRWRQGLIQWAEPNRGHHALAHWQNRLRNSGGEFSIITQNVDDLHERAGADVLAHLHGSIFTHRCAECSHPAELGLSAYDGVHPPSTAEQPPVCQHCAGRVRPDVVWFGEMLPQEAFESASVAIRAADVVLVVGTSGIVQPAASLPLLALERGTPLVEINPEPSELSELMDVCLRATAATVLPALVREVIAS